MRFGHILNIARTDLQVFLADNNNLVGLTIMPLIFTLILGFAFNAGGGANSLGVDIIDNDNSALSAQFIADLRDINDRLILCPLDASPDLEDPANCRLDNVDGYQDGAALTPEQARVRVADGVVAAAVIIPEGFGASITNLENVALDYYSLADITTGDAVLQSVQAVIQQIDGGVVAARIGGEVGDVLDDSVGLYDDDLDRQSLTDAVYADAIDQWANPVVEVRYVLSAEGDQTDALPSGFDQSVPGMATMFVMFTVLAGMGLLLRERQAWTLQRLIMMPLSRAEILGGKIVSRFLLGMLQFVIIFAVGLIVGMDFGQNPLGILIVMVTYTLAITAMSFALAPFFKDEFQAGTAVTLISLPLAALGGAWWPLDIVPDFMQTIGRLSPVSWAMDGFNEMIFYNGGLAEIVLPSLVLLGFSAVFFAAGIVNFRTEG